MAPEQPEATLRRWLPLRNASPGCGVRLFCLPFAGGAASAYAAWSRELPSWIEVCAVQLAGRTTRFSETPALDLLPLVDEIGTALAPLLDDGTPHAFYGHSLGGLIAFELARARERAGKARALHLFVGAGVRGPRPDERAVSQLERAELVDHLRRLKGTPAELLEQAELLDLLLPVVRADHGMYERYHYVPADPLGIPVAAFGGAADEGVSERDLQEWAAESSVSFRVRLLQGDHFFAFPAHAELFEEIVKALTEGLRRDKVPARR